MADARREFGNAGEDLAASFLVRGGMRVLDRQARTAFGEADLVCEDGDEVVFVEVKARQSDGYGYPEEAITPTKFRHMVAVAEALLSERGWERRYWRLDVVAIRLVSGADPEIVHLKAIDRPYGG
jgi:putative endonuclease